MSTSTAILLAGVLVALGLFFGLRSLAPGEPASAPAAPPVTQPPPPPPPLDPAVSHRHAANALSYHRGTLLQECYAPAVHGEVPPPDIKVDLDFTFDPEGAQVMRGLVEQRGTSRPAITQCVLAKLPPLRIPRPGQVVTVTLPLAFP